MGQPIRPFSDPGVDPVKSDGLSGYANGNMLRSQGVADLLRELQTRARRPSVFATFLRFFRENISRPLPRTFDSHLRITNTDRATLY